MNAGPIGGYAQDGEWKLDVRFDKEAIIAKIELIAKERERITVYNKDIISLLRNYVPLLGDNLFSILTRHITTKVKSYIKTSLRRRIISVFVM